MSKNRFEANKSFDDIMKDIKKENYNEFRKICERLEGIEKKRVDAIIEMIKFDENFKITKSAKKLTKVEEDGVLIYKCDKPTYIEDDVKKQFDTIRIEASDAVKVAGSFDTSNLELKNCVSMPIYGRIVFDNVQSVKCLTIKDTAVRGRFNVSKLSIDGITYLDIYIDADDEYKDTELIIRPNDKESSRHSLFTDEKGKNIRGRINLSINFYNKLSKENKIKILDNSRASVDFFIDGIPTYIYRLIKFKNIDIEEARKQLMRYKEEYGKSLSKDVKYEDR